jgi:hypothetical protein
LKEGVYEKLYAAMDLLRDCPENIEKLCWSGTDIRRILMRM